MMTKVERLLAQDTAKKLVGRFTKEELWDRYKAAKTMDDKEEVYIFRQVIKLQLGTAAR